LAGAAGERNGRRQLGVVEVWAWLKFGLSPSSRETFLDVLLKCETHNSFAAPEVFAKTLSAVAHDPLAFM